MFTVILTTNYTFKIAQRASLEEAKELYEKWHADKDTIAAYIYGPTGYVAEFVIKVA